MKGLKTGYVFVITTLTVLSIVVGTVAFYPSPKRFDYPSYPRLGEIDYDAPEYKNQLKEYNEDIKKYEESNKDIEAKLKIWGENAFIVNLVAATILLIAGLLLIYQFTLLAIALLFTAFVIAVFGSALTNFYADNTTIPFLSSKTPVDLSRYKQIQFAISLFGTIIGAVLGFLKLRKAT